MTSSPSTLLGLELQGQNDNVNAWWSFLNQVIQGVDDSIAKEVAVSTTGGTTNLTATNYVADQSRCPIIRIANGQTLGGTVNVYTTRSRIYFVTNESSAGAFSVNFGSSGDAGDFVTMPRGFGAFVRIRGDGTAIFAGPVVALTTGAVTGVLMAANNLSDIGNAVTARSNLGLIIGTDVQAYSANLAAWSALAPAAKQDASANLTGWSGDNSVRTMSFEKDYNGNVIATGIMGDMPFDFACTITGVTMLADQTGSAVVDIWKQAYGSYPPLVANSITAAAKPTISGAIKSQDTTLTGWTTAIAAGDILRFNLDSISSITRLQIALKVKKF
jgi:hypothetical protein